RIRGNGSSMLDSELRGRQASGSVSLLATGIFLSGIAIVIVWLATSGTRAVETAPWVTASPMVLFALGMIICLVVCYWMRAGLLEVIVAYFFAFAVGLVSYYQSLTQTFPWVRVHDNTHMEGAAFLCIVVLLCWMLGLFLGQGRPFRS